MLGVKPYLTFPGNCSQAVDFYVSALGAEVLFRQSYGESPMKGMAPDDKIMHCTLKVGHTHVMACDNMGSENPLRIGNNIALAIGTSDVKVAEAMFEKMSDGGTVLMPMQETFWALRYGMLTDKFGITWMFNVDDPTRDNAQAAD